jgi:arginyl-tRNA synthetase
MAAIGRALDSGSLKGATPESIKLERPKDRTHGDYASSIALQLAKPAGMNPREVAQIIADQLTGVAGISKVDIAGPGFINITLNRASQAALVETILKATKDYGKGNVLAGVKINLEFISANPTGPLHLGHTRWAAVGDALGRVLTAAGAQVTREFYINDRGNQMDYFGQSVEAVALGNPVPENGYQGEYIKDLAADVVAQNAGIKDLPADDRLVAFREAAYQLQLKDQQRVLDTFNTHFDVWFSERSLHEQGAVEHGMEKLRAQGHVFEVDGAVWLRTTDFGDDKDRVMVRSLISHQILLITSTSANVALIFVFTCWALITTATSVA